MRTRLRELHVLVLYLLAFAGILMAVLPGIGAFWLRLLPALCWLLSFTARNLYLYASDRLRKYAAVTYAAELAVLCWLSLSGAGVSARLLFYVSVADCYIAWSAGRGTAYAAAAFALYLLQFAVGMPLDVKSLLTAAVREAPAFLLTGLVAYLFGRVLRSNHAVEESIRKLQLREAELKAAYDELDGAYRTLEEMTALRERNRIAREIHDTVGHTMTTVIVELEAGLALNGKGDAGAVDKFRMARGQAVKGLEELRESVRLLSEAGRGSGFRQALLDILKETQSHADVAIRYSLEMPDDYRPANAGIVTRALKEGLANGIRHGRATAFYFELAADDRGLSFLLQDNGAGCAEVAQGFGLKNMRDGVEHAGGSFRYRSEPGEGFELELSLPGPDRRQ